MDYRHSSPIPASPQSVASSPGVSPLPCIDKLCDIRDQILNENEAVRFKCLAFSRGIRCPRDTRGFKGFPGLFKDMQNVLFAQAEGIISPAEYGFVIRMLFCDTHRLRKTFDRYVITMKLQWNFGQDDEEISLLNSIRQHIYPAQLNYDTPRPSPNPSTSRPRSRKQMESSVIRTLFNTPEPERHARDQSGPFESRARNRELDILQAQESTQNSTDLQSVSPHADNNRLVNYNALHYVRDTEPEPERLPTRSRTTLQRSPTSLTASAISQSSSSDEMPSNRVDPLSRRFNEATPTPLSSARRIPRRQRPSLNGRIMSSQNATIPQLEADLFGEPGSGIHRGDQRRRATNIPLRQRSKDDTFLDSETMTRSPTRSDSPNESEPNADSKVYLSATQIDDAICAKIRDLAEWKGRVYIIRAPVYTKRNCGKVLLKIGRSGSPALRAGELRRSCNADPWLVHSAPPVIWDQRIEELLHCEFKNYQVVFNCNGCGRNHTEWYDVTEEQAKRSLERWLLFMMQEPYNNIGLLKDRWSNTIHFGEMGANNEQWDDFESRDSRWTKWVKNGLGGLKVPPAPPDRVTGEKETDSCRQDGTDLPDMPAAA